MASLRSSGFLTLPSDRTLRDYSHYYARVTGFHNDIDNQLLAEIEQGKVPDCKRYIALSFDEIKIKEGLVYNKYNDEIIGFTDLGNINEQLLKLEEEQEKNNKNTE